MAWKPWTTKLLRSIGRLGLLSGLVCSTGCILPQQNNAPQSPMIVVLEGADGEPKVVVAENGIDTTKLVEPKVERSEKPPAQKNSIRQVQNVEVAPAPNPIKESQATPLETSASPSQEFPIDLSTTLALAGANSLQVKLAGERIQEADARLQGAQVRWIPSLNVGVGYNWHNGRLQDTRGTVPEVKRSSLYFGGGAVTGPGPLAGGSNGPLRFTVGLPLADVLFPPLAERQMVNAANHEKSATFNEALLQSALAYTDLVEAQGEYVVAQAAIADIEKLIDLIEGQVKGGKALPADALRAKTTLTDFQRQVFEAEQRIQVASAELARLLRLDATVKLFPMVDQPTPITMVGLDVPLPELLAQGLASRPELAQRRAVIQAACERVRQEHWRPYLPTVQVGMGVGEFMGGSRNFLGNLGARGDLDAQAVWEIRNLGLGNDALRRERSSQRRQASLSAQWVHDTIVAQITSAYRSAEVQQRQITTALEQMQMAAKAVPLNIAGVKGGELRAIEAQQAILGLASSRSNYLASIMGFNRSQLRLLYAVGQPIHQQIPAGPSVPQAPASELSVHEGTEPELTQPPQPLMLP